MSLETTFEELFYNFICEGGGNADTIREYAKKAEELCVVGPLKRVRKTLEDHRDRLERLKPSFRTKDGQTELRGRISAFETAIAEVNALILELE